MVTGLMIVSHYFNITFHKTCSAVAILIYLGGGTSMNSKV